MGYYSVSGTLNDVGELLTNKTMNERGSNIHFLDHITNHQKLKYLSLNIGSYAPKVAINPPNIIIWKLA